jgi:choice-of-anchor A domain-containing protein
MTKSSRLLLLTSVAAAASLVIGNAQALTYVDELQSVLGTYNVFLSGDMGSAAAPYTSDIEGRAAIGGNAYFQNFSIGANTSGGTALVVGNGLTFKGGTINGAVVVGGNASFPSGTTVAGTVSTGGTLSPVPTSYSGTTPYTGLPVNFTSSFSALEQASAYLASAPGQSQGTVGTVSNSFGTLVLASNATSGMVFFNLTASQLVGINGLNFQTNAGTTAIINVSGTPAGTLTNFGFQGNDNASDILFNFTDASTLTLQNIGFDGSILAPHAAISGSSGVIDGTVIAQDFYGSLQTDLDTFDGSLPSVSAVPEPASWVLMMVGFGGLGFMTYRRNAKLALAAA